MAFGLVFAWFFGAHPLTVSRRTAFELFPAALAGWTLAAATVGLVQRRPS